MSGIFRGVIFCLIMMAVAGGAARADKITAIQQNLAGKKAAHAALAKKASFLNSEVASLENRLVTVSRDLRASEESLSDTDQRLKALQEKKIVYLDRLYQDQQTIGGLVSAMRKYAQTSTPSMLVQSKPIDAARAAMVMKLMLPSLHEKSADLHAQLAEIATIEENIAGQLQAQIAQNQQLNKKQAALGVLLQDRKKIYQSTESERLEQKQQVAVLTKESRNIEELMEKLKVKDKQHSDKIKLSRTVLPADIRLPVHGKLQTGFGEQDALGAESRGLTFVTRPEAQVVVPLAGKVKFAGAFQNYKQILIVEHQGGYHSLVAGLGRIDTVVGASLAAGEPVGAAAASGSPQIYYELRQNGKPVNPQKLLLAQRKQEKS